MAKLVTTFPTLSEAQRAMAALDALALAYEVVRPAPGFRNVGAPALVMDRQVRGELAGRTGADLVCSGWVECRSAVGAVPHVAPPAFEEDVFGRAAVMVLASCSADERKIRIIAHISGDLSAVFPYLNAEVPTACYSPAGPTLTFMDGYRTVSAYAHRIAVAKADDIADAWRVLEELRCRANEAWARRQDIEPSYERRQKPPALEIYRCLPGTNCGRCGEGTCLAFAVRLHGGRGHHTECAPVFDGQFDGLRDALIEVCKALGVEE